MKNYFKKKWRLVLIFFIIFSIFLLYRNKDMFLQKFIPSYLVVRTPSLIPSKLSLVCQKAKSPLSIRIPVIGVDAKIEYVGLTLNGEMGTPKDALKVAWFNLGPVPGEEGTAVIAGHLDDKSGKKAVFFNLKNIKKGDKIFIEDDRGSIITFVVKDIRVYDSEAFAPEIFGSIHGQHLNLITCMGAWNEAKNQYQQRLVVFSDFESKD